MTTWSLVSVRAPCEHVEVIADFLWAHGVAAIEEIDMGNLVELRTSCGAEVDVVVELLQQQFSFIECRTVEVDRAVADTWRDFVEEVIIDDTFSVLPAWKTASSINSDQPTTRQHVAIDPEDVFGLGNHPTTIGALRLARRHVAFGSRVFDYGTGSGVLAIALAHTHDCKVSVYDIAMSARDVVERNAARNAVHVEWRDIDTDGVGIAHSYDVVIANILAPVLIEIAPHVCEMVRPGGLVVLAGMRDEQWESVHAHYQRSAIVDHISIDGWMSVALAM